VPKIPRVISQERPGFIPGARVSPEAMTQDLRSMGQAGETMSQLGGTLSNIGIEFDAKLREAREASEYSGAENTWKEGVNAFKLGLDKDTDYKTYSERFEKEQSRLYNQITPTLTEKNAQTAFKRFVDKDLVGERFAINHRATQTEINFMKGDYYKQIELAVKRGDTDFINKSTAAAVSAGYIKADVGEAARENALKKVEYDTIWQTAISMPDEETAMEFVEKSKGLSPGERNSLLAGVSRHFTAEDAKQKEELEAAREAQRTELLPKLRDGDLTPDDIYNSAFDEKEKKQWFGWMDSRNKAISTGKVDPLTVTDDIVYGDVSMQVNSTPETITTAEIWSLQGHGLSTNDCEKLTKRLDGNLKDPVKFQGGKRAHASLLKLKNQGVFGEGVEAETIWGQKANALDNYLSDNPDASNEEITTFFEGLVAEEQTNYFGKILDAYWNQLTFGFGEEARAMFSPEKGTDDAEAIKILREGGHKITQENIDYVKGQLK